MTGISQACGAVISLGLLEWNVSGMGSLKQREDPTTTPCPNWFLALFLDEYFCQKQRQGAALDLKYPRSKNRLKYEWCNYVAFRDGAMLGLFVCRTSSALRFSGTRPSGAGAAVEEHHPSGSDQLHPKLPQGKNISRALTMLLSRPPSPSASLSPLCPWRSVKCSRVLLRWLTGQCAIWCFQWELCLYLWQSEITVKKSNCQN